MSVSDPGIQGPAPPAAGEDVARLANQRAI